MPAITLGYIIMIHAESLVILGLVWMLLDSSNSHEKIPTQFTSTRGLM